MSTGGERTLFPVLLESTQYRQRTIRLYRAPSRRHGPPRIASCRWIRPSDQSLQYRAPGPGTIAAILPWRTRHGFALEPRVRNNNSALCVYAHRPELCAAPPAFTAAPVRPGSPRRRSRVVVPGALAARTSCNECSVACTVSLDSDTALFARRRDRRLTARVTQCV